MLPAANKSWPHETSAMTCQTLTLLPMSRKNLNKLATPCCAGDSYSPAALTSNSFVARTNSFGLRCSWKAMQDRISCAFLMARVVECCPSYERRRKVEIRIVLRGWKVFAARFAERCALFLSHD